MEPMTLGSPTGSPASTPYLPAFLMGDQTPTTPRNNIMSPNKSGRSVSFAGTPGPSSPQEYNRSILNQKTLFGAPTPGSIGGMNSNYSGTPLPNHNASLSGPPIQGLFDALRNDQNKVHTPSGHMQSHSFFGTPTNGMNNSGFCGNQSYQQPQFSAQQYNDSHLSNASYNLSRSVMSPIGPSSPTSAIGNSSQMQSLHRYSDFWVTVFGFPPSATPTILQHFAQCGTIVDKVFPPQNGNWVHLKYSSRLEADKALNYNEKILGNNIMIGVTQCKDRGIVDKENLSESNMQSSKIRPLAQTAYKSVQSEAAVVPGPTAPQKSTGLMNKAIDLFFGW